MAGNTLRPPSIGVGSALRRARELRGASLDEASRDTRLRVEQLRALEDEDFESLGEEVYIRATLRTYALYLGLDAEKVSKAYARHAEDPAPPPPPAKMGRVERAIAATRVRDNQRFLLIAALVVLVALVAVGFVSRRSTPPPGPIATDAAAETTSLGATEPGVDVTLEASRQVEVGWVVDGEPQEPVELAPGEVLALTGVEELTITLSDGSAAKLSVNGEELGTPRKVRKPWTDTFLAEEPAS